MRKALYYVFALILLYLVVVHFGGFGKDLGAVTNFSTSTIKALQGR